MTQINGYSAQGYTDLRGYKELGAPVEHATRLRILLWLAFTQFSACILPQSDAHSVGIAHVPSTNGRPEPHPVAAHFMSMFGKDVSRLTPIYNGPVGGERNSRRAFNPTNWDVLPPGGRPVDRVIVLDDTWVSGGHAQSVASAYEAAGVPSRIVVLGRALDPTRNDHGSYLRSHTAEPFNADVCPVHRTVH